MCKDKKIVFSLRNKPIGPAAQVSVNSRLLFFLLVLIPYAGYRVTGYGVTLIDVTPPQATTKIMEGMAEWQKEWMAELAEW